MKKVFILLSLLLLSSCYLIIRYPLSVPKKIRKLYTQCYSIERFDSIPFRIDGYYNRVCDEDYNCIGSSSLMFYNDGTVVSGVTFIDTYEDDKERINKKYLYNQGRPWGTFTINNDTIITQIIHNVHNLQNIHVYTFKIIDKTTLLLLSNYYANQNSDSLSLSKSILNDYEQTYSELNGELNIIHNFIPLEKKPNNTHFWLKKKKWFWCDEQEYKEYMRKLKKE